MEAIIHSMTPAEREPIRIFFLHPESTELPKVQGVDISEVNRMIKQFNEMKKLMKQFGKPGKKRKVRIAVLKMIYCDATLYEIKINYENIIILWRKLTWQ